MARYNGKVTTAKLDDAADVERDLSAYVTDVSVDVQKSSAEATAKGDTAQRHTVGHYGAKIALSGRWDDTVDAGPDAVLMGLIKDDAAHGFEIGFGGDASGQRILTGSAFVTAYTPSSPFGGTVEWSATLVVDGVLTEALVAP